jgi:hypothetical protein
MAGGPRPLRGRARGTSRVLRGGAFNNNRENVRCAVRNRNHPNNRNNDIGFRVVLSTLFSVPELFDGVISPLGPRRMAESVPGRVPLQAGRAHSKDPAPWVLALGRDHPSF